MSPTSVLMFRGQKQCHLTFICVCAWECECAGVNESLNWLHISYLKGKWVDTLSSTITSHQNSDSHSNCPALCLHTQTLNKNRTRQRSTLKTSDSFNLPTVVFLWQCHRNERYQWNCSFFLSFYLFLRKTILMLHPSKLGNMKYGRFTS